MHYPMKTDVIPDDTDITVGLPVRNGGPALRRAVTSILDQSFERFLVQISDNASEDETASICSDFAAADRRIRYVRQRSNIGAMANFRAVLARASTPFFIWVAHDDWIEPGVLERCRAVLLEHTEASAAIPETIFHEPDGSTRLARGSKPVQGAAAHRLASYLARPADNSRFYGLHRTAVLKRAFPADLPDVHSFDWAVMALSLAEGSHVGAAEARLHRTAAEPRRYLMGVGSNPPHSSLNRVSPTTQMTRELLRRLPLALKLAAIPSLLLLAGHQAIWHNWLRLPPART
jgi:glycosyltransferase involved in cell wall biosynthesis